MTAVMFKDAAVLEESFSWLFSAGVRMVMASRVMFA